MLKSCQSCGEKCHISRGKCPNCKVQFTSKKEKAYLTIQAHKKAHGSDVGWNGAEGL